MSICYDPADTNAFPMTDGTSISVIPWDFNNPMHASDYYYHYDYRISKARDIPAGAPEPVQGDYFERTYDWVDRNHYDPIISDKTGIPGATNSFAWEQGTANFSDAFAGYVPTAPSVYLYRLEEVSGEEYISNGKSGISFCASTDPQLEPSEGPDYSPAVPHIRCNVPIIADAPDGAQIQVRFRLAMGYDQDWQSDPSDHWKDTYYWYVQDFILNFTVNAHEDNEPEQIFVQWLDDDGTLLYGPIFFDKNGTEPPYPGESLPTKVDDEEYTYAFREWDKIIDVDENIIYTAVYDKTPRQVMHTVTINYLTDDAEPIVMKAPDAVTIEDGGSFDYQIAGPGSDSPEADVIIPWRLGASSEYVLDEASNSDALAELSAAHEVHSDIEVDIVYSLDVKGGDDPNVPEGGHDNVPDKYQAKVQYRVLDGGTQDGIDVYETITDSGRMSEEGVINIAGATAVPDDGYAFMAWTTEAEGHDGWSYDCPDSESIPADAISAKGGAVYTFTASFEEDKKGPFIVTIHFQSGYYYPTVLKDPVIMTVDKGSSIDFIPLRQLGDNNQYAFDEPDNADSFEAMKNIQSDTDITFYYSYDVHGTIETDEYGMTTDTSDGIPDIYQVKVVFRVVGGSWNDGTNDDVIRYLTKYKLIDGQPVMHANGEAVLGNIIPYAGLYPDKNHLSYRGTWTESTPTPETTIKTSTVYVYSYYVNDSAYPGANKNKTIDFGDIVKYVGEDGYVQRIPIIYQTCPSCKAPLRMFSPDADGYDMPGDIVYDESLLAIDTVVGEYEKSDNGPKFVGEPCCQFDFAALRPGTTKVESVLYYYFGVSSMSGSYVCGYCRYPIDYLPGDYAIHYDDISFTAKVVTDYTVDYVGDGVIKASETIGTRIPSQSYKFTAADAPADREGYIFKGWSYSGDGKIYQPGDSVTMFWEESDGKEVKETMTAVWKKSPLSLSIVKTATEFVMKGDTITYGITVSNPSDVDYHNVAIEDILSRNVTLLSATLDGSDIDFTSGICTVPLLEAGKSAVLEIKVIATAVGTVTNKASVDSDETDPADSNEVETEVRPGITGITKRLLSVQAAGKDVDIPYGGAAMDVGVGQEILLRYEIRLDGDEGAGYELSDPGVVFEDPSAASGTIGPEGHASVIVTKSVTFSSAHVDDLMTVHNMAYVKPLLGTEFSGGTEPDPELGYPSNEVVTRFRIKPCVHIQKLFVKESGTWDIGDISDSYRIDWQLFRQDSGRVLERGTIQKSDFDAATLQNGNIRLSFDILLDSVTSPAGGYYSMRFEESGHDVVDGFSFSGATARDLYRDYPVDDSLSRRLSFTGRFSHGGNKFFIKNSYVETAEYTVTWYGMDGNVLKGPETRTGTVGDTVSVADEDKLYDGYIFDGSDSRNILSAELSESGTELELYFRKLASRHVTVRKSFQKDGFDIGLEFVDPAFSISYVCTSLSDREEFPTCYGRLDTVDAAYVLKDQMLEWEIDVDVLAGVPFRIDFTESGQDVDGVLDGVSWEGADCSASTRGPEHGRHAIIDVYLLQVENLGPELPDDYRLSATSLLEDDGPEAIGSVEVDAGSGDVEVFIVNRYHKHYYETVTCPDCIHEGLARCSCGDERPVEALGHDFTYASWKDGDGHHDGCGSTEHIRMCDRCSGRLEGGTESCVHDYDEWVVMKEPTCTETGVKERHCKDCDHFETTVLEKAEHAPVPTDPREPDCIHDGMHSRTQCSVCGAVVDEGTTFPALGHDFTGVPWKDDHEGGHDGTCESEDHVRICKRCHGSLEGGMESQPHDYEAWTITRQPTVESEGLKERYCKACDHAQKEPIPKMEHTIVIDEAVKPNCIHTGLTEGIHCSECGEVLVKQETVPALGHDFTDAAWSDGKGHTEGCTSTEHTRTCVRCHSELEGGSQSEAHSYSEWKTVKEPTETEDGLRTRHCLKCDHIESEPIDKLPVKPVEPDKPTEPQKPTEPEKPKDPAKPEEPVDVKKPDEPELFDIPDDDTPLANVPQTGDDIFYLFPAFLSGLGLILRRRRK